MCSVVKGVNHAGYLLAALVTLAKDHHGVTSTGTGNSLADGLGTVADLTDPVDPVDPVGER